MYIRYDEKKYPLTVIIIIIVSIVVTSAGTVSSSTNTEELIIGFKDTTTPSLQQAMAAKYGYTILARNDALNCVLVEVTRSDTQRAMNALMAEEDFVRYVEAK